MNNTRKSPPYFGRFAPSPTGDLHFGSLLAAVASYLQARANHGQWLVRVENIDPPREVPGSSAGILSDLELFGLVSDQAVLYQSTRADAYQQACDQLEQAGLAYWCVCSRKDLPASGVYQGTCRNRHLNGETGRSLRIRTDVNPVQFEDLIQGSQSDILQTSGGDFIIKRADGLFAYQLAVVVDDAAQNITEVVRGADLLDSTARQICLQQLLELPTPRYAHIPLAVHADGSKLSKSTQSDPLRCQTPAHVLRLALRMLGHEAPKADLVATWEWAVHHWSINKVPAVRSYTLDFQPE